VRKPRERYIRLHHRFITGISREQTGILTALFHLMDTRWNRQGLTPNQACSITLCPGDIRYLTQKSRIDKAESSLSFLVLFSDFSLRKVGENIEIICSNYAKLQGLGDSPSILVTEYPSNPPIVPQKTKREKPPAASPPGRVDHGSFSDWYAAYPRKAARAKAEEAWSKIRPSSWQAAVLMAATALSASREDWSRENGNFIPYPSSWLNQRRWEDEPTIISPKLFDGATPTRINKAGKSWADVVAEEYAL